MVDSISGPAITALGDQWWEALLGPDALAMREFVRGITRQTESGENDCRRAKEPSD